MCPELGSRCVYPGFLHHYGAKDYRLWGYSTNSILGYKPLTPGSDITEDHHPVKWDQGLSKNVF